MDDLDRVLELGIEQFVHLGLDRGSIFGMDAIVKLRSLERLVRGKTEKVGAYVVEPDIIGQVIDRNYPYTSQA